MTQQHNWIYIAIDPGKTTGVACWDETCKDKTGQPVYVEQFSRKDLTHFLFNKLPGRGTRVIIYEDYKILKHKANMHIGSELPAVEVIGEIKAAAYLLKIETVAQPAQILPIAQKWSGLKLPSDHSISHWPSAFNHGFYWLQRNGLITPRVLREAKKDTS